MDYTYLKSGYIREVATIISSNYEKARLDLPILSEKNENIEMHVKMLEKYIDNEKFIVAIDKGKIAGFMYGFSIDNFKGTAKGVLSLPSHHGIAEGYDKNYLYTELYRRTSELWVNSGCYTHCLMLYANDKDTIDSWILNGFGRFVFDAVRPLNIINLPLVQDNLVIRKASSVDIPKMVTLFKGLDDHLASTPIFLHNHRIEDYIGEYTNWLKTEGNHLWIAEDGKRIVGYIKTNTKEINIDELQDGETMGVSGAYVLPEYRGGHIMCRLLNATTEWAIQNGMQRCSTDFESANIEGRRFWLKHFEPCCCSIIRRIDERNHLEYLREGN